MTTDRQNFEKECSVRFAKALKFGFGKEGENPNFEYWKKMLNLKWVRFQIRNSMMIVVWAKLVSIQPSAN